MLKKLYKHEFYSLFRSLLPFYAVLFGFALLSKISYLFDTNNKIVNIAEGLVSFMYVLSICGIFIVGLVVVVCRFYKNLLSHEGYLTFTLPFTATQHIVCKLVCGVVVTIINFLATIASLLIIGIGTNVLDKIFKAIPEFFNALTDYLSGGDIALICTEIIVMAIIYIFQGLLMVYAAMAIGQQFKNKIGGAVLSYIGLYAIVQVISTIFMTILGGNYVKKLEDFDNIEFSSSTELLHSDIFNGMIDTVQSFIGYLIVFSLVLSVAYFLVSRYFLSKKLNLE